MNRVLPHPTNASILYIGSANGGVWKTTNALASVPHWVPLTDSLPSLSIGALDFDYSDPTYNTIVAGIGAQSSAYRLGGLHLGVLRTTDGGNTWTVLGAEALYGYRLAGVAAHGSTISVCAVGYGLLQATVTQNGATFYSTDTGATWTRSNNEACTDAYVEPSVPSTVFRASLQKGVVVSKDSGVTWQAPIWPNYGTYFNETIKNIRISVRNLGSTLQPKYLVYAGFNSKTLQALMRGIQDDVGDWTWIRLDSPTTNDNGTINGLSPESDDDDDDEPGSQGYIHFSIVADIHSDSIVYVGGDRQPMGGNDTDPSWPNGIGATTYTGRLFKCDASLLPGNQCIPLTHIFAGNHSAPHCDSRDMRFDASGRILEGDDGGVYFRAEPQSTKGAWGSVVGNLQIQEAISAAYLGNGYFVTGNQDGGTTYGVGGGSLPWVTFQQGDGAVPRCGRFNNGSRILYHSYQTLGEFSSTIFDANTNMGETIERKLQVQGSRNRLNKWVNGTKPTVGFYQIYAVNRFNPNRIFFVLDFHRFSFESFDAGDTVYKVIIAPGVTGQTSGGSVVYGGVVNGISHENLTYAAGLDKVAMRDENGVWTVTNYPPAFIRWPNIVDVAADPSDFNFVAVLGTYGEVSISPDRGQSWTYLSAVQVGVFAMADSMQRRIAVLPATSSTPRRIIVSGRTGAYVFQAEKSKWWRIGGWPNAFVYDMGYDAHDDVLFFSTLGRSVWQIQSASTVFSEAAFASIPIAAPPKSTNWQTLTYVFAGVTCGLVLVIAGLVVTLILITKRRRGKPDEQQQSLLSNTDYLSEYTD